MYEITVTVELTGGRTVRRESVSEFVEDGLDSLIGDVETIVDEFVAEVEAEKEDEEDDPPPSKPHPPVRPLRSDYHDIW